MKKNAKKFSLIGGAIMMIVYEYVYEALDGYLD